MAGADHGAPLLPHPPSWEATAGAARQRAVRALDPAARRTAGAARPRRCAPGKGASGGGPPARVRLHARGGGGARGDQPRQRTKDLVPDASEAAPGMAGGRSKVTGTNDGRGREPAQCSRTRGLIGRVLDDRVTVDDRAHGATCPTCGPVLVRAARFEDDLRRTAQGFVSEELPRGVLDPALSGTPRVIGRGAPGLIGIATAVAVMLVAMTVTLFPSGFGGLNGGTDQPAGTPVASAPAQTPIDTGLQMLGPALVSSSAIGESLTQGEWVCTTGEPLQSPGPGPDGVDHEGVVCTSPESTLLMHAVLITGETVEGAVVQVTMK